MEYVNDYGQKYDLRFRKGTYANNGSLAVVAECIDEEYGGWEPYCTLTVNLDGSGRKPYTAFVDSNNVSHSLISILEEKGYITPTFYFERSGWCEYYEYVFSKDWLDSMEEIA